MASAKYAKKDATKSTSEMIDEKSTSIKTESVATENKKKEFRDSDPIACRSVTAGGLNITCKSGGYYEFNEYGSECDIEYRDLVYLVRKHSEHVFNPNFVILDEDFLNEFPKVRDLYENMYTPTELHEIIELPIPQMKNEIARLPETAQKTLVSLIATEVANGRLDSIKKVKVLSDMFDSDFNLLSELFGR